MKTSKRQQSALKLALVLTLASTALSTIFVSQPDNLRQSITNWKGEVGILDYTVSTFGYLDYQAATRMQVLPVGGDKDGCNIEDYEVPEEDDITKTINTAFLMKRGGCTYFQKAEMTRRAGGNLAIVALVDPHEEPESVIPIAPKARKLNLPELCDLPHI